MSSTQNESRLAACALSGVQRRVRAPVNEYLHEFEGLGLSAKEPNVGRMSWLARQVCRAVDTSHNFGLKRSFVLEGRRTRGQRQECDSEPTTLIDQ
jgi:hypothetical protein